MDEEKQVVLLSDTENKYYKCVTDNMHRLAVDSYEKLSMSIGVDKQVIERCVKHYFYKEENNRSQEVKEIVKEYTTKEVETFSEEEEKQKHSNKIRLKALRAIHVINMTHKGNKLEDIAYNLQMNVESVRKLVTFFFAFRDIALKKETIGVEASARVGNQSHGTSIDTHASPSETTGQGITSSIAATSSTTYIAP